MDDLLFKLLDDGQETADMVGMGMYYNRLREEMQRDRDDINEINSSRGKMPDKLKNHKPNDDEILLINAETGKERRIIHEWAERNGLKSIAINVDCFHENRGWKCKECNNVYYDSEVYSSQDWNMEGDVCYGSIIRCPNCYGESVYSTEDPYDPECDTIKPISVMLNGVAVGNSVELLKKTLRKKRRKKKKKDKKKDEKKDEKKEWDVNKYEYELAKLPLRDMKIIKCYEDI